MKSSQHWAANRMDSFSINGVVQAEYQYNYLGQQAIRHLPQQGVTIDSVFGPDGYRMAEFDHDTGTLLRETATTPAAASNLTASPETARAVAIQIAEVITSTQQRAIELKLHPEELGRVSITLSQDGGGLNVALTAERTETLDLMRRHIDDLGEELRRLGYSSVGFSFDGGGRGGADQWEGPAPVPRGDDASGTTAQAAIGPTPPDAPTGTARVDLRL